MFREIMSELGKHRQGCYRMDLSTSRRTGRERRWPWSPSKPTSPAGGSYADTSYFTYSQTTHEFKFSNFGRDKRSSHGKSVCPSVPRTDWSHLCHICKCPSGLSSRQRGPVSPHQQPAALTNPSQDTTYICAVV